jgi:hypothetical protein
MDKVFKGLRPIKPEEKTRIGSKVKTQPKMFCSLCQNEATKFAMFGYQGVTIVERYCETCISQNRHLDTKA